MPDNAPGQPCLLCHDLLAADAVAAHLRSFHEVAAGEVTVADVPTGRQQRTDAPDEIRMTLALA
jgi:hypothetical protein